MTRRIRTLQIFFILWFIILFGRLFYWQALQAYPAEKSALSQYGSMHSLPAARGQIESSDGYPLVKNGENYLLYIEPAKLKLTDEITRVITDLLPASASAREILAKARNSNYSWLALAHGLNPDVKAAITSLNIAGLGFEPEPVRIYPEGSSSACLTGFVGKDDTGESRGYFGLEGFYDRILSGKPGRLIQELDALNKPILIGSQDRIPPVPGQNLITSIDRTVQYLAFQKLAEGIAKYQAKSGTVSVMDVRTGRILAMASLPGYDPADFTGYSPELYKNPIVSEGYEPGSTFKVIVMSSALDAKVVTPDTVCTTCTGPQLISGQAVRSYNDKYYPNSTMTDVILHSDNVGMIFVARKLGKSRMLDYIRKYGFGKLTGIDLQEESAPVLRPDDQWQDIDWATVAFGQGIAVTRLQMLSAVNALARGGKYIAPRLVTGIESGGRIKEIPQPEPVTVISPEAAVAMTQMMINGVEKGEVRYYRVPGYLVAGKTGTAQVPIAGHYDEQKVIASFIGFAPADDPKFTMLVTLREPKTSPWGSTTAAPLWFGIAGELFRYFRIAPRS
jgi:cell division protein FtsI/penicillin-binding protein 2